jgi:ATP-dependent phosphoenolpyruvate carboxykinase
MWIASIPNHSLFQFAIPEHDKGMKLLLVSVYSRRVSECKTTRSASIEPKTFVINRERVHGYLNIRDRLYCVDGFAGWDPKNRFNIGVICSRPYHRFSMGTF